MKTRSRAETLVAKCRLDLSARFKDIAEKQVPAKLKPIIVTRGGEDGGYSYPRW